MNYPAQSYAATARNTMTPRELEATALLRAAARLQSVIDGWPGTKDLLDDTVTHNRRLWTIFATSMEDPVSTLPEDLKLRLLTLANFVFNQSALVMVQKDTSRLGALIRINRELAAGLRTNG